MAGPQGAYHRKDQPRVAAYKSKQAGRYEVLGLPVVSPLFANRPEAEKWLRAELAKQPQARRPVERPCMCCGGPFLSQHIGNRLCPACGRRSDGGSMAIAANSTGKVRRAARA